MEQEKVIMAKTKRFYEETPYNTVQLDEKSYDFLNQNYRYFQMGLAENGAGVLVLDAGCGYGWVSNYFKNIKKKKVLSLDLSFKALKGARDWYQLNAINATNLCLPMKSACVHWVVSSGVIHHTPNAYKSFKELVRVLKPGGILYLSTYGQETWYYPFFKYVGGLLRFFYQHVPGAEILYKMILLPPFYFLGLIRSVYYKRRWITNRDWNQVWNHFRDFVLTPQASFHKYSELERWFQEGKLEVLKYEFGGFGSHNFFLQKES